MSTDSVTQAVEKVKAQHRAEMAPLRAALASRTEELEAASSVLVKVDLALSEAMKAKISWEEKRNAVVLDAALGDAAAMKELSHANTKIADLDFDIVNLVGAQGVALRRKSRANEDMLEARAIMSVMSCSRPEN